MKKKRFMGFLALASCVTLLTGCNSDAMFGLGGKWNQFVDWGKGLLGLKQAEPEQKPEEEEPAPAEPSKPEVKLTVFDLPEEVLPGTVLDLEEFVSVSGTNEAFAITLDEGSGDLASVEGHKLTAVGEGVISITVSVGDQSAKLSFRSISNERKVFRDFSKDIKDDFVLIHMYVDSSTHKISLGGEMTHGAKYSFDEDFKQVSATEYAAGGYFEGADHKVYSYLLEQEGTGDEATFVPRVSLNGDEPASISAVAGSFALDWEKLEVIGESESYFENDYAYLLRSDEAAVKAMLQMTVDFTRYAGVSYYGTQIEEFPLTNTVTGDAIPAYAVIPQIEYGGQVGYWDIFVLYQDSNNQIPVMEEFVKSTEAPQGQSFEKFKNAIDKIVTGESFTISTDYGLYDGQGVKSDKTSADFSGGTFGNIIGDCSGTVNAFVTPNQIHVEEFGMDNLSFGYIKDNEGKVYSYNYKAGEGENPGKFVATATSYSSFDDLDALESYRFLAKDAVLLTDTGAPLDLYESIFVNESVSVQPDPDNEPDVYYNECEFCGKSAYALIRYLIYLSTPNTLRNDVHGLDYAYYQIDYNNEVDTFAVYVSFINDGETIESVSISTMIEADSSGDYFWGFNTTISVGATIPDRIVVEFPAAA